MTNIKKRVLICGHTGATGNKVLAELVDTDWVEEIVTIGRRNVSEYGDNKKVKQIIVPDMTDLSQIDLEKIGKIDIAYELIATSVKDAFKGEAFYRIADVGMTSEFARLAKKAGAEFLGAIGMTQAKPGADEYAFRAKADFEIYARTLNFGRLAFMKPMWVDRQQPTGFMEKLYMLFAKNITKASDMAHCLVWAAKNQTEEEKSYTIKEIGEIGKQSD